MTNSLLRRIKITAAALLVALPLAACDAGASSPQPTPTFNGSIKVGVSAPYTGDTADGGIQIWQGAQLAVDEINAKGGVLGKKIDLVVEDDAASPATAQAVAKKLVDAGVVAVVGHKDSGVSIPASQVYHAAGVIQITPTSSNPGLTAQGFDTVFRVCPIDATQGPLLAEFITQKLNLSKVAVIYADTAYGKGLRAEFEKRLAELGATPVASEQIHRGDKDFTATLQKIQPLAPQVVFYAGSLPEGIIVASQMKELGIKAGFVGGDTLFQPDFTLQAGEASEGAYVASFFPDVQAAQSAQEKDWVAKYRDEFKRNPGGNSSGGYVAAVALFEAMKQANSADPAVFKTKLQQLSMDSFIGRVAFDSKGDLQDQRAHLHIFQVKNSEFVAAP